MRNRRRNPAVPPGLAEFVEQAIRRAGNGHTRVYEALVAAWLEAAARRSGPPTVSAVADRSGMPGTTTRRHLARLVKEGRVVVVGVASRSVYIPNEERFIRKEGA